jgi:hypothetical protein
MKSCLGFLLVMLVLAAVFGSGALIWYLSTTAEFTRKGADASPAVSQTHARPVNPPLVTPPRTP